MDINNQIRHLNLRESKRKLVSLEIARRKRTEINELINKELRIKNGAQNLLNVCNNSQSEQRLKLELTFVESKIKYLKDQLAELNCDFTLYKMKNSRTKSCLKPGTPLPKPTGFKSSNSSSASSSSYNSPTVSGSNLTSLRPLHREGSFKPELSVWSNNDQCDLMANTTTTTSINTDSFSPSSSSSSALTITPTETPTPLSKSNSDIRKHSIQNATDDVKLICSITTESQQQQRDKSADLMIYLNLKETNNSLDFSQGFKNFIWNHYREESGNFIEQIRQFNYFRESTIKQSYEPKVESIQRLFEYFNSLQLLERRFFQNSQCNHVFFTWYDSINGVESTQKSIQFEKASILFNCATLYTQLAAICCDGKEQLREDQLIYWQKAAGCLHFLTNNFSNSPSFDMSSLLLNFFIDIFICQAYEVKAKLLILDIMSDAEQATNVQKVFCSYMTCARIYSHISSSFEQILVNLEENLCIKTYLPEIWYYLIKIKSIYYKGLSHYYAAVALTTPQVESLCASKEARDLFENLYDRKSIPAYLAKNLAKNSMRSTTKYFQKMAMDQECVYGMSALGNENKFHLARAHMRESAVCHEEAMRQHGFCRKFSPDDYLFQLLKHYHENSLDKLMLLENHKSEDFDDELFEILPMNVNLNEQLILEPIEPNFHQYEFKEFFNLIGPLKIYSSEIELSIPYSCILKKQPEQRTFGITVKGDCPVRINHVDPKSYAYTIGIREGSFIIEIQGHDVRWLKHSQVVERIRSYQHSVKLTLVNIRQFAQNTQPIGPVLDTPQQQKTDMLNEIECIKTKNTEETQVPRPISKKSINHLIDSQATPPSSIGRRLFKNTKLTSFPAVPVTPITDSAKQESNLVIDAANKLYNLAKSTGSTVNLNSIETTGCTLNTYKNDKYRLSSSNLNPIRFTSEDLDVELTDKENQLWQNLKSLKTPLTSTITLGRRFKRNVLKLSIFNSFSTSTSNLNSEKSLSKTDLKAGGIELETKSTATPAKQHMSSKLLKKKKKLKELEKNNMELFKKMADENGDSSAKCLNQESTSDRFDNKTASIYKTL